MNAEHCDIPFQHTILSDVVPDELISAALQNMPSDGWITYDNPLERKRAIEDRERLTPECNALLDALESPRLVDIIGDLWAVGLAPSPDRRGAGIHAMHPGDFLQTHLDYAIHPNGMQRHANLILFLTDAEPKHGGGLQLCDPLGNVIRRLYPKRGEAVVWQCTDLSYHGVEIVAAESWIRYTAACYYLGAPQPGAVRRKALYLPRR